MSCRISRNRLIALVALLGSLEARCVHYAFIDDGSGQTMAPGGDDGWWDYVGLIGGGSGIYLGEYGDTHWAMTAAHVGKGTLNIGGTLYSATGAPAVEVSNPDPMDPKADIVLFRLASGPNLAPLALSSVHPGGGADVIMVGGGLSRSATDMYWDAAWNPVVGPDVNRGYLWQGAKIKRWASNDLEADTGWVEIAPHKTWSLRTDFDEAPGEGHAASGDSGGGVFHQSGGNWELAGLIIAVDGKTGQPASTSVFGNSTYAADMSFYRDTILALVPEPAWSGVAAGLGLIAFVTIRRRRS